MERFDLVDEEDRVIGTALRTEVHGNPDLIHRVAHVLVFSRDGRLFLQKRSPDKDVQPGKWDTSVGGHVDSGETYEAAAAREMSEELGVTDCPIARLYRYLHQNEYESEMVSTFQAVWDGPFTLAPEEITEGRFWRLDEIDTADPSLFTPNFLDELARYRRWNPPSA
jgi:isopentenyldiphosphate isomerase